MTSQPSPPEDRSIVSDPYATAEAEAPPPLPVTVSLPAVDDQATVIGPSEAAGADVRAAARPTADVTEFGEYELLDEIGRGPHGVVYRAYQPALDRTIAVKIIFPALIPDAVAADRFRKAMEHARRLDHPGIVRIFDVGTHDGFFYVAMTLCEGRRLDAVIASEMLPVRESVRLLRELTEILHAAHSHDVLHLGLKPSQVFVARDGSLKVTDFGLTAGLGIATAPSDWTYLAPEQIREPAAASGRPGVRTDLYAAGGILYALVTGRPPFGESQNVDDMIAARRDPPPSPTRLNIEANGDLEGICFRCLESAAWRRYATAVELMGDLLRWLHHRPLKQADTGLVRKATLWMQRNRASLAPAMVLLVVLGIIPEVGARVVQNWRWNDALTDLASPQGPVERYEQILRMARRAAACSPSDKRARLLEGLAQFRLGRLVEAEPLLVADRRAVTRELLAELHFRKGDLRNAAIAWSDNPPPAESAFRIEKSETDAMFHDVAGFAAALREQRRKHPDWNTGGVFREFCQLFLNATEPAEWGVEEVASSVPLWQEIVADQGSELRKLAAEALGRIGPRARAAVPSLARLMVDRDIRPENGDDTFLAALSAIRRIDAAWIHSSDAQVTLVKLHENLLAFDDRRSLPVIAEFGSAAEPLLGGLIEWLGHGAGDDAGRDAVVAALGRIDPEWRTSTAARKALVEWQAEFRKRESMKQSVVHAAGRFGSHGRPLLTELIVFAAWSEDFETLARQVLPVIEKDWETSLEARAAIPEIVSQIGAVDPRLWRDREDPLSFLDRIAPDWRDSKEGQEGVRRLFAPFLKLSRQGSEGPLRIEFLSRCGKASRAAIPALAEALGDSNGDLRERAEKELTRIDPEWHRDASARQAIVPLARSATAYDVTARGRAREALSRIDPEWARSEADRVFPALVAQLKSGDDWLRTMSLLDEVYPDWPKSPEVRALIPSLVQSSVSSYLPHGSEILERLDPPWHDFPEADEAVSYLAERVGPENLGHTVAPLALDRLARIGLRAKAAADKIARYLTHGGREHAKAIIALAATDPNRLASLVQRPTSDEVRAFRTDDPSKNDEPDWRRFTWEFQAKSSLTRVAFLPLDELRSGVGPRLDDVRMVRADESGKAASVLSNGSFEEGNQLKDRASFEIGPGSKYIEDWVVSGATVTVVNEEKSDHGDRSLVLGGLRGWGAISQDCATEPGKTYRVSFLIAPRQASPLRGVAVAVRATGLTQMPANEKGERPPSPEERFLALEAMFLKDPEPETIRALRTIDPGWGTSAVAGSVIPRLIRQMLKDATRPGAEATLVELDPRWPRRPEATALIGELVETLQDESAKPRAIALLTTLSENWRREARCRDGVKALLSELSALPPPVVVQRIAILEALGEVGPAAADVLPAIIEYVPHENLDVAEAAARALDVIHPEWTKVREARSILLRLAYRGFRGGQKHAEFANGLIERIRSE